MAYLRPYATPLKRSKKTSIVVPGYTRRVGNYGRYAGAPGMMGGRGELKFFDRSIDDATIATAGTNVDSINKVVQGIAETNRIGRKITIRSIWWKWQLKLPTFDAQGIAQKPDTVRVIMYLDKQTNGATATADGANGILSAQSWQAFPELTNKGRFNVLYDKLVTLNINGMASDGTGLMSTAEVIREGTFYKRCNIPIEFNSSTGAIGEIRSNNIGVLLLSSAGLAGMLSLCRIRFSDD